MAQKGFAVISGSSSVVAKIMENGQVSFGHHNPVDMSISGTLVLKVPSSVAGDGRAVLIDSAGSASLGKVAAANVIEP